MRRRQRSARRACSQRPDDGSSRDDGRGGSGGDCGGGDEGSTGGADIVACGANSEGERRGGAARLGPGTTSRDSDEGAMALVARIGQRCRVCRRLCADWLRRLTSRRHARAGGAYCGGVVSPAGSLGVSNDTVASSDTVFRREGRVGRCPCRVTAFERPGAYCWLVGRVASAGRPCESCA
eukprot:scaffold116382_cov53-Phaeocystis_antarctica.AAC.1